MPMEISRYNQQQSLFCAYLDFSNMSYLIRPKIFYPNKLKIFITETIIHSFMD